MNKDAQTKCVNAPITEYPSGFVREAWSSVL
jgi:hypothetical protein